VDAIVRATSAEDAVARALQLASEARES
jgi:hypothetical protein